MTRTERAACELALGRLRASVLWQLRDATGRRNLAGHTIRAVAAACGGPGQDAACWGLKAAFGSGRDLATAVVLAARKHAGLPPEAFEPHRKYWRAP